MTKSENTAAEAPSRQRGLQGESPLGIDHPQVIERLEEYRAALEQGRTPSRQELLDQHPEIVARLGECLDALEFMFQVVPQVRGELDDSNGDKGKRSGTLPVCRLGDFRIIRQIGKGGMGIVYEAEQISMGRRVALKTLPFAGMLDRTRLQRFKNEAQVAGSADHPNIVHVLLVGCERGVHYYVMQFIEGQTLAEVIQGLRQLTGPNAADNRHDAPSHPSAVGTERNLQAAISTEGSARSLEFFRSAADLAAQAAEGLEHAHRIGVVHRDVKPSNLMLDADGHLWITDFGLAMTQTDVNLTMTGDLLGTLRYMSPEQVQTKHGVLDHRTDIYSLGLTLYELLTLQPAFADSDRQKLMRAIAEEDPRSPRQLNGFVPKDLETIVLKAIAKEPQARYDTAGELAADLRRFIEDKPIRARRPSLPTRLAKWSRRHRAMVWAGIALLVMAVVALSVSTALITQAYDAEAAQRSRADTTIDGLLDRMAEAIEGLARRNGLAEVGQLVDHSMELDAKLPEEVRRSSRHRSRLASMHYQRGWGCARLGRYETAERSLRAAIAIYEKLAAEDPDHYELLLARCYYYLDDALRGLGRFKDATHTYHRVMELSGIDETGSTGSASSHRGLDPIKDERDELGLRVAKDGSHRQDEEIRHYRRKLVEAYDYRGDIRVKKGQIEKALSDYDEAVRLEPKYAEVYWDRGNAYLRKRDYDRAIADLTEAVRLDPANSYAWSQRGLAHDRKGDLEKAIADFGKAIEIELDADIPNHSPGVAIRNLTTIYVNRGIAYFKKGTPDKALADFSEAIRLDQKKASPYYWQGRVFRQDDNLDRAVAAFSEAIRLEPTSAGIYIGRGVSQIKAGRFEQAIADFDEAILRNPESSDAYYRRGLAFCRNGDLDRAVKDLNRAIGLSPDKPAYRVGLGISYGKQHKFDLGLEQFDAALSSSETSLVYYSRGRLFASRGSSGDPARARRDFDKAISLQEDNVSAHYARAEVQVELNEMQAALADVARARSIGARTLEARLREAWFLATCRYASLRDGPRAVELAKELTNQVPDSGTAWKILGAAWYCVGEYAKAQQALERADEFDYHAVDFYGSHGPGWFFLAMAHARQHNDKEARRWYDKAAGWLDKKCPNDRELCGFRDEATKVLGLTSAETAGEETIP